MEATWISQKNTRNKITILILFHPTSQDKTNHPVLLCGGPDGGFDGPGGGFRGFPGRSGSSGKATTATITKKTTKTTTRTTRTTTKQNWMVSFVLTGSKHH